ncbi:hypothetical protein [Roseobacter sinensis]|uniref:Tat pathway signal sequence domain protein n=1 Tax=Roseobacter sinensis TaxID=2931391 RepID=A0ABT3BKA2_9RHOB|nr:hypothetical protein [Roseobacter sp. WL0113]MCV3274009.1 hypothetical protein [Roseobacter sp. WL0113]
MHRLLTPLLASLLPLAPLAVAETDRHIGIELNATATDLQSCTLTFVVQNGLAERIEELVVETVLFAKDGAVDRLTLFNFGEVPAGRPRVRQFLVDGAACDELGQILFNGTERCAGATLTREICDTALRTSSRTTIEVLH